MNRYLKSTLAVFSLVVLALVVFSSGTLSQLREQGDELQESLDLTQLVSEEDSTIRAPEIAVTAPAVKQDPPMLLSAKDRSDSDSQLDSLRAEGMELQTSKKSLESQLNASNDKIAGAELTIEKLEMELRDLLTQRRDLNLGTVKEPLPSESEKPNGEEEKVELSADTAKQEESNPPAEVKGPDELHKALVASYNSKRIELDETREALLLERGHSAFLQIQLEHTDLKLHLNRKRVELQTQFVLQMEQTALRHGLSQDSAPPTTK
ncbi:MAG: hypothetical protein J5J00_11925 [Deltaproteobacteria bacterium]|nr:hypothetical protein [Deltaproteobacteria bacterium]